MKAAVFVEPEKMEVREVARPGAVVGRVGVPHTGDINIGDYWMANLAMAGGPASCTTYDKEVLLKAVLDGQINPGKVFTHLTHWTILTKPTKAWLTEKRLKL